MEQRIGYVALHRTQGDAHALGHLAVAQPLALGQQEGRADLGLEAVQQRRDLLQQLQDQLADLGGGRLGHRHLGQGLAVGPLQLLATPVIDHQPTGHGAQEGARCVQLQCLALAQQAQEGVLRQVGGIRRVAQLAAQPGLQPAVVLAVQRLDRKGRGHGVTARSSIK